MRARASMPWISSSSSTQGRSSSRASPVKSELVGPEVVIAHRLLKSRANEVAGQDAFMLVTDAAATMLEVPLDGALPMVETYDHYPPVDARVYPLRAA